MTSYMRNASNTIVSWQLRFWWSNDQDVYFIGKFCPLILETAQATTIDNGKIAM